MDQAPVCKAFKMLAAGFGNMWKHKNKQRAHNSKGSVNKSKKKIRCLEKKRKKKVS